MSDTNYPSKKRSIVIHNECHQSLKIEQGFYNELELIGPSPKIIQFVNSQK